MLSPCCPLVKRDRIKGTILVAWNMPSPAGDRLRLTVVTSGDGYFSAGHKNSFVETMSHLDDRFSVDILDANYEDAVAKSFRLDGVNIHSLVFPAPIKRYLLSGHRTNFVLRLLLSRIAYAVAVLKQITSNPPDLVYVFSPFVVVLNAPYFVAHRRQFIFHSTNFHPLSRLDSIGEKSKAEGLVDLLVDVVEDLASRLAPLTVVESSAAKRGLAAHTKLGDKRIDILETALSNSWFQPRPISELKRVHDSHSTVVVLFFSRLRWIKGVHIFVEAIRILVREHHLKSAEFIIAGPSYPGAGDSTGKTDYVRSIERRIHTAGIERSVVILNKWFSEEEARSLYCSCDIYVLPSFRDITPFTIKEAMACGKPVLATVVGGIPEVVEDGVTGYLVPSGSPEKLAERLQQLIQNRNIRLRMGEAARLKSMSYRTAGRAKKLSQMLIKMSQASLD